MLQESLHICSNDRVRNMRRTSFQLLALHICTSRQSVTCTAPKQVGVWHLGSSHLHCIVGAAAGPLRAGSGPGGGPAPVCGAGCSCRCRAGQQARGRCSSPHLPSLCPPCCPPGYLHPTHSAGECFLVTQLCHPICPSGHLHPSHSADECLWVTQLCPPYCPPRCLHPTHSAGECVWATQLCLLMPCWTHSPGVSWLLSEQTLPLHAVLPMCNQFTGDLNSVHPVLVDA